jgi:hypothetical protein
MPTPLSVNPQLFYGGAWHTVPIYTDDGPAVLERGYTDEGTIRPSKLNMRINDAAAPTLNPSNPASPLYGSAGRAIPVAVTSATIRAWLETSSLDPDLTVDFTESPARGKRWLDMEAQGPLFRIGQWSDTVASPMTRTFLQYANLIGYWPGDDKTNLSALKGTTIAQNGITLGDSDGPMGGAGSFVGSTSTAVVLGPVSASSSAGFQVFFSTRMPVLAPAVSTPLFRWRANNLLYSFDVIVGGFNLRTYLNGTLLHDGAYTWGGTVVTDWVTWRAKCYASGGNLFNEFAWFSQRTGVLGVTDSIGAGTIDRLTSIRIEGNAAVDGTRYSQIGALTAVADDLQSAGAIASFVGYSGERAGVRFLRLLAEAGIAARVIGSTGTTMPMGAQKPDTLMNLIKECAATEDGLVFDERDLIRLVFRTRTSRYNQVAALALTYPTHLLPPLKERLDNLGVQNLVTLESRNGGTATATEAAGPLSVQNYPGGIGVWKGGAFPDVDVNVSDPAVYLQSLADWYLARGTVPGPRFPTIELEVGLDTPSLAAACQALEIGDRVTITGRLPDVIELQVIGIKERIDTHTWNFTLTCIAGDAFQTGGEDSTQFVLDTYANNIITAPSPATTGTSMVVGSVDPLDVWSTTSLPYPIMVSGERMTVTAATAPALVSGTWRQTLTVTRSVNGVVKTQVAGTAVHVFYPIREAL